MGKRISSKYWNDTLIVHDILFPLWFCHEGQTCFFFKHFVPLCASEGHQMFWLWNCIDHSCRDFLLCDGVCVFSECLPECLNSRTDYSCMIFLLCECAHPALKQEDRLGKDPFAGFGTVDQKNFTGSAGGAREGQNMAHLGHFNGPWAPMHYFDLPWPPLPTRSNFFGPKWLVHVSHI